MTMKSRQRRDLVSCDCGGPGRSALKSVKRRASLGKGNLSAITFPAKSLFNQARTFGIIKQNVGPIQNIILKLEYVVPRDKIHRKGRKNFFPTTLGFRDNRV